MRPSLLLALLFLAAQAASAEPSEKSWETWDGCTLVANRYYDGDSFQVRHSGKVAVLRLYFIDSPETDPGYAQRVAEQAAYFGVSTAEVLRAGGEAKELAAKFMAKPFRVLTRQQSAPGASRQERFYAIVEGEGGRLDAALVQAGLARVTSEIADHPDASAGRRRETFAEAVRRRLSFGTSPLPAPHRVNLNTASVSDLEALPGIGPKTAEAIVHARPLADFPALDAVHGIGPKKIDALRDLVSF